MNTTFIYGRTADLGQMTGMAILQNRNSLNPKVSRAVRILNDIRMLYCYTGCILAVRDIDGWVAGYAAYYPGGYVWLVGLGSFSEEKGIGSLLMNEVIRLARMYGAQSIALHSEMDTIGFYEKFGFRVVPSITYPDMVLAL